MNIKLKKGYRYTSTVISALASAGNFDFTDDWVINPKASQADGVTWKTGMKRQILCNGFRFNSPKKFGEWMLSEINDWLIDCGLVDIQLLKGCKYQRTDCPFEFGV